jgi:hypothetical protein
MDHEHQLPRALLERINKGSWPIRLPGHAVATAIPALHSQYPVDYQFHSAAELAEHCSIDFQKRLREEEDKPYYNEFWSTYWGENTLGPPDVPWIDGTLSLQIAYGPDIGDESSICLDYRTSRTNPRVVTNIIQGFWGAHEDSQQSLIQPAHAVWVEIAPTVDRFLQMIEPYAIESPREKGLRSAIKRLTHKLAVARKKRKL